MSLPRRRSPALVLFLVPLLALASCSYLPLTPLDTAAGVTVSDTRDAIDLAPTGPLKSPIGYMFWHGGLVDPHAYVASLSVFAARGYHVVIVKVPLNLAITHIEKGWDVARALGGDWVLGGHSLGGTTASWTVFNHLGDASPAVTVRGLALLASYPADSTPLDAWSKPVVSLAGDHDGLATPDKIAATKKNLPPTTTYVTVAGGNHAQWGDYGDQSGDGVATLSKQAQWTVLADTLQSFWSTL